MIVNCSILEFSHKIRRLEMLASVLTSEFTDYPMEFPSSRFLNGSFEKQTAKFDMIKKFDTEDSEISIQSIINVLQNAKTMAHNDCKKLETTVDISAASLIQLKFTKATLGNRTFNDLEENEDDEDIEEAVYHNEDPSVDELEVNQEGVSPDDSNQPPSREEIGIFAAYDEEAEFPECLDENDSNLSADKRSATIRDKNNRIRLITKSSLC